MRPKPWSHSSLDCFRNCPRQYEAKYVSKSVKEVQSPQMVWGERVHKHFEDRIASQVPLPYELKEHEPYMLKLEQMDGNAFTERKIALDKKLRPCHFFGQDVFFRGIIDWHNVHGPYGYTVDYKTGKPHSKPHQLALFSIHMFSMYPALETIRAEYYWTKTRGTTGKTYTREQVPEMWDMFISDLRQYKQAYNTGIWQARPSGLCNGWCPVKTCEHWKPPRN
jgi:PD-(D/E)XK nuclease superfamily